MARSIIAPAKPRVTIVPMPADAAPAPPHPVSQQAAAPAHVPPAHIVDFDYLNPQGIEHSEVYTVLKALHGLPDILWSPRHGGHWIVTRSEDVRWVRERHEIFSHTESGIPRGAMNVLMPPVTVDPPYHARFRAVLNPAFTPSAARALAGHAREVAIGLIDGLVPRGSCEFVADFARIMPVLVFLKVMDLPADRREEFVGWAVGYTSAKDQETKDRSAAAVAEFLASELDARARNPGGDLLSRIVAWRANPRFGHEGEVLGMAMVTFIGGLDTLSNLLSFTALHLAQHPEARAQLIAQPEQIPAAAEEYIRRHGLTMTGRLIRRDVSRKGVTMKADEMLLVIDPLAAIDERVYPDPLTIDFDRDTATHDSFGNAEHKCVGEHLARMELVIFLEEWLRRIPDFAIDPAQPPVTYAGPVIGVSQLGLTWHG
jgi:cytochrome P450